MMKKINTELPKQPSLTLGIPISEKMEK